MTTYPLYRVDGHAGLWLHRGQAVVTTDHDSFEHDLVLIEQAAAPGAFAVAAYSELHAVDEQQPPIAV